MHKITINGKEVDYRNIYIDIESKFELEQVFCSCMGKYHEVGCVKQGKLIYEENPEECITLTVEDNNGRRSQCRMKIDSKTWKDLAPIQSVDVNLSLNRSELFELGKRSPYFRYIQFPVERTVKDEIVSFDSNECTCTSLLNGHMPNCPYLNREQNDT